MANQPMSKPWAVPVVVFHHVSPSIEYYTNTPPNVFAKQVEILAKEFNVWTVEEAYQAFLEGTKPNRQVILTFDDGYEDNFVFARPILADYGLRASFFVIADYVGRMNDWNGKCSYHANHMTWDQLRSLADEGHEIASHGLSHRALVGLDLNEASHEIAVSRDILIEKLKCDVRSFSYPYGLANAAICDVASRHYTTAFSTVKSRCTNWYENRYFLRRTHLPIESSGSQIEAILTEKVILGPSFADAR